MLRQDWKRMMLVLERINDDGLEEEIEIKAHSEVCATCDGKGKHDHPAFANGITSEEWDRDWGEDEREDYMAGRYDVVCSACKGLRVMLVENEDDPNYPILEKWMADQADYRRECEAERRMGA